MQIVLVVPDSVLSRELVDAIRDALATESREDSRVTISDRRRRNHDPDNVIVICIDLPHPGATWLSQLWPLIAQLVACELPPASQLPHLDRVAVSLPLLENQQASAASQSSIDVARIWAGTYAWAYGPDNLLVLDQASAAECLAAVEHIAQNVMHYWSQAGNTSQLNTPPMTGATRWLKRQPCWLELLRKAAGTNASRKLREFLQAYMPNLDVHFTSPRTSPPAAVVMDVATAACKRKIQL